jgi:hypothetical protein
VVGGGHSPRPRSLPRYILSDVLDGFTDLPSRLPEPLLSIPSRFIGDAFVVQPFVPRSLLVVALRGALCPASATS